MALFVLGAVSMQPLSVQPLRIGRAAIEAAMPTHLRLRATMGDEAFERAYEEGRRTRLDEVIALVGA